jgi:hypothetical protein
MVQPNCRWRGVMQAKIERILTENTQQENKIERNGKDN